jgi:acetyl coenzyme A synthetase (ADP forming)-like protein
LTSEPRALDAIFSPRSVAVLGASRDRTSLGWALLHNLLMAQLEGPVYPVNPKAEVIHSLRCYPKIGAIPDSVDLAVILVPKAYVEQAVDECLEHGVRGLVVISAGFAETGEEGAELEQRICEKVRRAGARMVGPNCMGVINTHPAVRLDATFAPTPASPGSIGFVSQSGALGVAILNVAGALGLGLTQFASLGNKADVSGNDLLEYWENDDTTRVIAMYLESFGNPRHFAELARRVSRKKPILMVKSGRTEAGARAASSHTGALAGLDVTVEAFLERCGVVRANTIEELFDLARAFDRCPLPRGPRVAIVTNAGGPGIMATDACVNLGLEIAELSQSTRDTLRSFLPAAASIENPVDMIASADPPGYRRALDAVLTDPGVDTALAIHVTPLLADPVDILESVAAAAENTDKPVLVVIMARESFYDGLRGQSGLPPVYRFPESAALAIAQLHRYAAWRERREEPPACFAVDDDAVKKLLDATAEGYLPPEDAFAVLETYGIPVARCRRATTDELADVAAELGFPVVLKAIAPDLVHKSDLGAVAVGLESVEALEEAAAEMTRKLEKAGHAPEAFLVQEQVPGEREVIFGMTTDPRFGPLLMFGLGGRYVEVLRDVRFTVTPLGPGEAMETLRSVRGFPLLEGVRGDAPADLEILSEVLQRLAQLVERHPRIAELDINPFLAATERQHARAVDVRIRVTPRR